MTSPISAPQLEASPAKWSAAVKRCFRSHWTFAVLQILDLITTIAAFRVGAFEANPLVAHLTLHFGRVGGVFASKVIAVLIALGVRRLLWVVNLFYICVVCWNVIVLVLLSIRLHLFLSH